MAHIDDRGHEKAELVMFDPQAPNFQKKVVSGFVIEALSNCRTL